MLRRQRQGLVERVRVQRLRTAEHGRQSLVRDARDVVVRLLGSQRHAGRLRMRAQPPALRLLRSIDVAHVPGPDPPSSSKLRDLLEEVVVHIPEKGEARREFVHVETPLDAVLHVRESVLQRVREFLARSRASFPDVIAADRDRVEAGGVLCRPFEDVADDPQRRLGWIDPRVLRHVLLQDVVLDRPPDPVERHTLLFGSGEEEAVQHDRRAVDRHRHGYTIEGNSVEQSLHVGETGDCHAALSNFALGHRIVRVVSHQRRKVERHRETGLAPVEQELVPLIGFLGRREAREQPHRPQARAVHRLVRTPCERILARKTKVPHVFVVQRVKRRVQRPDRPARNGREVRVVTLRGRLVAGRPAPEPVLQLGQLSPAAFDFRLQRFRGIVIQYVTHAHPSPVRKRPPVEYTTIRRGRPSTGAVSFNPAYWSNPATNVRTPPC